MPELPEVETVRRTLAPAIGSRIESVWDSGQGLHMARRPPRAALRRLVGARISALRRIGKYLLIDTDAARALLVHLGMTGRLRLHAANDPRVAHTHVVLGLSRGELRFSDPRRFGQIDVVTVDAERAHAALRGLGADPLTDGVDPVALHARARRKTTTLKALLMDQGVLAGVGNIYASEALWRARLRPTTRSNRLTLAGARRLATAVVEVLDHALTRGGTSLRDFVNADGAEGTNAAYLQVYDREDVPCPRCKTAIRRVVLQGRATYYCPTCQKP